ncbi:MAG: hypothetical protein J2O47_03060, partial [Acidimicrobiaceae bacterium]|nr:hypothetical protein [Acidimicrobiaceae bacterium]
MYTVASYSLGSTSGLGFMNSMAHVWLWVGVLAWAATTALLLVAVIRGRRRPRSREPEGRPSQPATA